MTSLRAMFVLFAGCAALTAQGIQPADLWKRPVAPADRKLAYGQDASQFGELRLPKTKGLHPVVILVHGGCYVDRLPKRDPRDTTFETFRPLAAALAEAGIATWNLEYRRAGSPGGGWPGTFLDLAAGTDFLRTIATEYQFDLNRVVILGHSAGGSFAHWIGARLRLPRSSPLYAKNPLKVKAIINVDGPPDLTEFQPMERKFCPVPGLTELMGGTPAERPERYRQTSVISLLPIGIPQTMIAAEVLAPGDALVSGYETAAKAKGDSVTVIKLEGARHFDMLAPESESGKSLIEVVLALLK